MEGWVIVIDLKMFVCVYRYKLSSMHCFSGISYFLLFCVFVFIQFLVYSNIPCHSIFYLLNVHKVFFTFVISLLSLLIPCLISLMLENILCMFLDFLNWLKLVLWPNIWCVLENFFMQLTKIHIPLFGGRVLSVFVCYV